MFRVCKITHVNEKIDPVQDLEQSNKIILLILKLFKKLEKEKRKFQGRRKNILKEKLNILNNGKEIQISNAKEKITFRFRFIDINLKLLYVMLTKKVYLKEMFLLKK